MTCIDIGGQAVEPRLASAFRGKTTLSSLLSNGLPGYWILLLALLLPFFIALLFPFLLALLLVFLFGH
jgi:hypothetical protein